MFDIAVVGNGASAVFALLQLAKLAPGWRVAHVTGTEPGHGIAYSSASSRHLLNVPADRMGALPDQPDHFWHWLANDGRSSGIQPNEFVPRGWYGDYLHALLESLNPAPSSFRLQLEHLERTDGDRWRLRLSDGAAIETRKVILALGLPSLAAPWPARPGVEPDGWRWWQALPENWQPPPANEQVVLVGSGLTAIDLALGLRERGFRGRIRAVSPSGRWSEPHAAAVPLTAEVRAALIAEMRGAATARALVAVIDRYSKRHPWRAVIDALRADSNDIWRSLAPLQRRRLLNHSLSVWNRHRHRVPPTSLAAIHSDEALTLERGRVVAGSDGLLYLCEGHRDPSSGTPLSAALVVNCAGAALANRPRWDAVYGFALRPGFLRLNELESGLVSVRPQDLAIVGACRFGDDVEATAVPELRSQARDLAAEWATARTPWTHTGSPD